MLTIDNIIFKIEQIRQGRAEIIINLDKLEELPPDSDGKACIEPIEWENPYLPCISGSPLWEQLPWETGEQYKMFRYFKGLGVDRTLFSVAKQHGKKPLDMVKLSKMFHWKERANAYDYYETSIHEYRIRERQRRMTEQHFTASEELFAKCSAYCNSNLNAFEPKDVLKLMDMAAKLGRQALGLGQENTGRGGTVVNVTQQAAPAISPGASIIRPEEESTPELDSAAEAVQALPEDALEAEKVRIAGIINIMKEIGAFEQKESVVEQLNTDEIIMR